MLHLSRITKIITLHSKTSPTQTFLNLGSSSFLLLSCPAHCRGHCRPWIAPLSCHPPEALSNCTACQGACGLVAAGRGKKVNLFCLEEPSAIQVFGFCRLIVVLTNDHSTAAAADAATFPLPLPPPLPSLPLPLPLPMLLPPPLPLPPQLPPLLPPLLR